MISDDTRALSLHQPWAELVAIRAKEVETRSWGTRYRGTLFIHASGAKPHPDAIREQSIIAALHRPSSKLERGAVVAVAELYDCVCVDSQTNCSQDGVPEAKVLVTGVNLFGVRGDVLLDRREFLFGDLSLGRWAWLLRDVHRIRPVPARGFQGLWRPDPFLRDEVVEAVRRAKTARGDEGAEEAKWTRG